MPIIQNQFITRNKVSYSQFLQKHQITTLSYQNPNENNLVDIDFFRRSISVHYQHIYADQKRHNWLYRSIFWGFSLLFLIFGIFIYFKTVNFNCGFYLTQCSSIKSYLNMGCLLLAGGSLGIGYMIQPEKDAFHYVVSKIEKDMRHPVKELEIDILNTILRKSLSCA